MPLRRVPRGSIDPYEEPPRMRRFKEGIEEDLRREYDTYLKDRFRQGDPGRFSRPLEGQTPYGNTPELSPRNQDPYRGISYTPSGYDQQEIEAARLRDVPTREIDPQSPRRPTAEKQPYTILQAKGMRSAGERQGPPVGLVFHYSGNENDTVDGLVSHSNSSLKKGFGYNWVIDKEGVVHQMTPLNEYTNHIMPPGSSQRTDTKYPFLENRNTVSVGLLGDGRNYTDKQIASARNFGKEISNAYEFVPNNIVSHADLQSGPGGNKSVDELYDVARYVRSAYEEAYIGGLPEAPADMALPALPPQETYTTSDILRRTQEPSPPAERSVTAAPERTAGNVSPAPPQTPLGTLRENVTSGVNSIRGAFGLGEKGPGKGGGGGYNPPPVPQLPESGANLLQAAGPESEFPVLPPPPPRTPPGQQPPFARRRSPGRGFV